MKIGILTFYWAYNYGAILQAYGLRRFLEGLGHDVHFINGLAPRWWRAWGFRQGYRMPLVALKRLRFDQFRRRFIPVTPPCRNLAELQRVARDFSAVIVGSDQVWNGNIAGKAISHYFLDFVNDDKCRRISYAACFGCPQDQQPVETIEAAKTRPGKFDSISVRNEMSAQIVSELSGRQAEIVLDPTLLHDFEDISGCKGNREKGYIASYCVSLEDTQLGRHVLNFAKNKLQLPAILIGGRKGILNADDAFIFAGPLEWLRFFQESSFVCTDSFHGTIFAVKFRKPFITWSSSIPGRGPQRAQHFLKICGLENRLVDRADPAVLDELINSPIDYDAVSERLEPHINSSRKFLEQALAF